MISVNADVFIVAIIIFCSTCGFAGYVIGCMETVEKYEKETP